MSSTGPMLFCGDPHGEFGHICEAAERLEACAVILLGDLEPRRPLPVELGGIFDRSWFIHGNHDTDTADAWRHVWSPDVAEHSLHGRVVTLPNGVRIAGLGGVFREGVWKHRDQPERRIFSSRQAHARSTPRQDRWQGSVQRKHWSTIYPDEFEHLLSLRADVLVTHEAPGYHPYGVPMLDLLARSMRAKISVHGHHHDFLNSSDHWQAQGFMTFGLPLRGLATIDTDGNVRRLKRPNNDADESSNLDA